ncbi:MAG: DNA polymerase I [Rhodospirillales bacterium CG15_BIG_FIL_POST_REV_8_21_14_020_66_15]|nr:MAG: DNA polymerase I [Rhodospirillales bacterium CG15_BIG_FIL_POST_REV_8_21_14_020_66_15]
MNEQREHVFLVDGSGFIFRAYHALPPMTAPDGTPTNAVFGFTKMLMKLVDDTEADYVAVIFDRARKTFRNDIYPEYKAHRPPPPDDLIPQFDLVRKATEALNVPAIDMEGFEADDLIATYARQARERGAEVTIVSSDKDLMQLVDDRVSLFDAMKNREIGPAEVVEKFGVGPDKVVDVQALAGDSSDNVPGIAGIGVKTAAQLIGEYGDLDTLLARAGEIKQPKRRESLIEQADMARLSRDLVTLKDDVPVARTIDDMRKRAPNPEMLLTFLRELGFKSLVTTVESRLGMAGGNGARTAQAATVLAPRYELVQSLDRLRPWIDAAYATGVIAVDTETDALDAMGAGLVGVSLATEAGRACYIPLAHVSSVPQGQLDLGDGNGGGGDSAPEQIPLKDALAALKPMLEDPSILKVGQNIKYDIQVLGRHGVEVGPVDDTMLLSYVLDGGLHGHGMDDLARDFLDHETIKFKDVTGTGKAQVSFDRVPLDKALDYAAEDADITLRLFNVFKPRLVAEHMVTVYETLERPLIPVLRDMERRGIKVDAAVLKDLSADFAARMDDLEGEIHRLAGHEFNIASPKQLGEILFDEMGLDGGKKTKTGAYGTGADVLEELAAQGHDLPQKVLDWRQLAKLKSTYTDTLVGEINPKTGRVHTTYSQAVAVTGRLASSDPNLQNIPIRTEEGRKIRTAFVADTGFTLMSADYSQIELRLLAHVADIAALKEAFHAGLDIHALTASQVFGVPVEGMDPMVRRRAKAINFGIIYGISAFGLARQLGISRGEAGDYIDAYFERYPGIKDYMERTKEQAKTQGFVETVFGRKCHVRGINDRNPNMRGFAERAAINAPIQGGAADIIKRAMIRLPDALSDAGLGARMLLQVHDELIFEVPDAEIEATRETVTRVMSGAAHLSVPLDVDVGTGANWDEAH